MAAGDTVRQARAAKAADDKPVTQEVMQGAGCRLEMAGIDWRIMPLTQDRKTDLDEQLAILGDTYYNAALIVDNPEGFSRMARVHRQQIKAALSRAIAAPLPGDPAEREAGIAAAARAAELLEQLEAEPEEQVSMADAITGLRLATAGLSTEQETAMLRICQLFLRTDEEITDKANPDYGKWRLRAWTVEELAGVVPLNGFPRLLCRFLDTSELNP